MYLTSLTVSGFKSFGRQASFSFSSPITAIVGPNGSGKSNVADAFRFVLGEQSVKSLRGKRGEDLIWGGSHTLPRASRASVSLSFNNAQRLLPIDFDEVVIERVVFRDGIHEYLINGAKVRLKDVHELLAGARLGASGYHIISQGEADRALSASPRERRRMIEDALGVRVFQYKKEESLRKLEKTEENMARVEGLRRENAPHLAFLSRQMKKLEKAHLLKEELSRAYAEYLKREEVYLASERATLTERREHALAEIAQSADRIEALRARAESSREQSHAENTLRGYESDLVTLRAERSEKERRIGRAEGELAFSLRKKEESLVAQEKEEGRAVSFATFRDVFETMRGALPDRSQIFSLSLEEVREALFAVCGVYERMSEVLARHTHHASHEEEGKSEKWEEEEATHRATLEVLTRELADIDERVRGTEEKVRALAEERSRERELLRRGEQELFSLTEVHTRHKNDLVRVDIALETLEREKEAWEREVQEGVLHIGRAVLAYRDFSLPFSLDAEEEPRSTQLERKRALEKMKIRLEELGGTGGDDVSQEYKDACERDEFLTHELHDLAQSAESLRALIADIDKEVTERFARGVAEIERQFSEFFSLMFGGGSARLIITEEKKRILEEQEEGEGEGSEEQGVARGESGVDIEVALPKKRVQSLMMLSGGERTLTSIAFIFAMSQINPPPFLLLDETDAALDEANARRYGDMIRKLSEKSQLLLITHNRETMSRAGVLYGVTMGADGVSRTLSVHLGEAEKHAK